MKRFFAKLHLWLSIPFGLVIAIVCVTGAVLVFEDEIKNMNHPERYLADEVKEEALAPSQIVARAQQMLPDSVTVTGIRMFGEPERNWRLYVDKGWSRCVNPYTGRITGEDTGDEFVRTTTRMHRFLLHSYRYGVDTPWGKLVVGYSTIAFVFILISGIVIWWPINKKMLKNRLKISTRRGSFRFWYDLHVAGGMYASIFLLAMALTGLTWSFKWYRTAFYTALGGAPTQSPHGRSRTAEVPAIDYAQWDKVYAQMSERYPDCKSITLKNGNVLVSTNHYGNIFASDRFAFDPSSGDITKSDLYDDSSRYSKLKGWVWSVHSGQWGGIVTRLLHCIAALLGAVFVLTGYYFWIRRLMRPRKS